MSATEGAFVVVTILVCRGHRNERVDRLDPAWLEPGSSITFWVDLQEPTPEEAALLRDPFHFHELAVEDALSERQFPKVESYDGYLYLVLHGINFKAAQHRFATHDIDFFLGRNFLVSIHGGRSRTFHEIHEACVRNERILAEGPSALLHRLVDTMVDHYQPEVDKLEKKLEGLEVEVLSSSSDNLVRKIIGLKRDVASLRRVAAPQRDVLARLARREFPIIDVQMAYRFRDVYDHVVRLTDEALMFQDRVTGILEAHLSDVSNRLNAVVKVLTVIATIFMPLTVLTGLYGMNVRLPALPGGEGAQFWWVMGLMTGISGLMLWFFHRQGWV